MNSNISQFDSIFQSLSVRAKNCCNSVDVHSIEELSAFAASHDLLKVPHCGHKTVLELKAAIDRYVHSTSNTEKNCESVIPESILNTVENTFDNQVLSIEDEEIFNSLCNRFSSASVFVNSIVNLPSSLFNPIIDITYRQNIKLWDILLNTLLRISNISVSSPFETVFINKVQNAHNACKRVLNKEANKLLFKFISSETLLVVETEYNKRIDKLGTRAQNYLSSIGASHTLILDILDDYELERSNGKGYRLATIVDIINTFEGYKNFIIDLTETDNNEIEYLVIQHEFPFLNSEQVEKLVQFKSQEGRIPFFYVVFCYFCNTPDRESIMYDRYTGISLPAENLNDIAISFKLSRERVRQIISRYKPTPILHLAKVASVEQYPFLAEDVIDVEKCFSEISEIEFSTQLRNFIPNSFAVIVQLFTKFNLYDFNGSKFLLSENFTTSFDISNSWIDVNKALNSKTLEDVSIPIDFFISNYILSNKIDYVQIRDFIVKLIVKNFDVEIDDDFNILLQKNFIDFENELFTIIERAGKPMLFEDIIAEFYETHSEYASKSPATLRLAMFNSPRIKSVGKTSSFTLAKWNFSTLTVRGLIAAILQESDVPLSLDTLVEILETKGRKTNKNSVNSSILSDTKNNFVKFKGGLVGIGSKIYDPIYEIQDADAVARKSFSERLKDYTEFIDTNFHIPFSSQDDIEASLYRWYRNVEKGIIDVTPQQKEQLQRELKKREQYIMSKAEFDFLQRCNDFKYYVSTEFDLPTQKSNSSLYLWFLKARKESDKLSHKNKVAYSDLLDFLAQYGFSFV